MVSVIVPIYKVEKYLRTCIDSIINQTFSDLEIILVDDGSPDGCGAVCDEYARRDKRIRVIHKDNGGLSDARNAGLDVCKGEYIAFVDSDDQIHPRMIEKLYQYCREYQAELAVCEFQPFLEGTSPEVEEIQENTGSLTCFENTAIMEQLKYRNLITVVAWNKLYKASLLERLRYKKGYLHEDEFLIHKILHECNRTVYTDEKLYFYLKRKSSITGEISTKYIQDELEAYQDRVNFLKENQYFLMQIETQKQILHKIVYYWKNLNETEEGKGVYQKWKPVLEQYLSEKNVRETLTAEELREYEAFLKNEKKYFAALERKNHGILRRIKSILYYKFALPLYKNTLGISRDKIKIKEKYHITDKNIVILGTPNHGNLGDYAIGVAEKKLFRRFFPGYNIFDVNLTDFPHEKKALRKALSHRDILVLTGGGNLGNQYMDDENVRRDTIRMFPRNRIYVFPQTCYFTEDAIGEEEKRITTAIYNKHNHLLLMARDRRSYEEMQHMFQRPVRLMPDVVLTMNMSSVQKRDGALLLLRSDVERKYTSEQMKQVESLLQTRYNHVDRTDTEISTEEFLADKEGTLKRKLEQIMHAGIVVTDRLHGMIFAAITGTPCIALDNYNHKIRETYNWLEHLPYILYITDLSMLEQCIGELMVISECRYDGKKINEKYDVVMQEIING